MNSPRDLRRRIRSISSTAQITKAMQMVAASKMRKAQLAALAGRPFVQVLYRIQREATTRMGDFSHPLLESREVRKRAIILVGGDKGLCGALNSNIFRLAAESDPKSTLFITAGRKAAQFIARTGRQLVAEFAYGDTPQFSEARAISAFARDLFLKRTVDQVQIIATRFVNTLTQQALCLEFLPVGEAVGLEEKAEDQGAVGRSRLVLVAGGTPDELPGATHALVILQRAFQDVGLLQRRVLVQRHDGARRELEKRRGDAVIVRIEHLDLDAGKLGLLPGHVRHVQKARSKLRVGVGPDVVVNDWALRRRGHGLLL